MLEKLNSLEERFEEVTALLSAPEVAQDQDRLRELGKEHQELGRIVEVYRNLKKLEGDIEGNKFIVATEDDPDLVAMAKEELTTLEADAVKTRDELKILLLPKDPNDAKNVIVEIRAGTGGDEASLFAGDLFKMYSRYAESKGWRIELMSVSEGTVGGFKEVIALFDGSDVFSSMKYESGVHRVQRVPDTESQGRIHTSAVTVAVLPEAEDVELDIAEKDLRIDVFRSSGPGGQSVNTTDSAVRITHIPTGLVVTCQDEKSQHKNKAKAMTVLRSRLLDQIQAEQDAEMAAERKSMVKSGDRSEKVRTYNFPQDRVTDHRIGLTLHKLDSILAGTLDDLVVPLRTHYQALALQGEEG